MPSDSEERKESTGSQPATSSIPGSSQIHAPQSGNSHRVHLVPIPLAPAETPQEAMEHLSDQASHEDGVSIHPSILNHVSTSQPDSSPSTTVMHYHESYQQHSRRRSRSY